MTDFLKALHGERWLDLAASLPLAFAQVREDALIDLELVEKKEKFTTGIMIASGGCTAALLAASAQFESLTLVDMNPAQLALTQLKMSLIKDYTALERLQLLGHLPMAQREKELRCLTQRYQIPFDMFGPVELMGCLGPDLMGRYEFLFARLRHVLGLEDQTRTLMSKDRPQDQKAFLNENPRYLRALESAFREVMALPNLVRLFGSEATQNSIRPFSEHFFERTQTALETHPAATNPYLSQVLLGCFQKTPYPWFELEKQPIETRLFYQQKPMEQALVECAHKFDFIHLSNILDWLSQKDAKNLLDESARMLKQGGRVIIRQLNSSLKIRNLCPQLTWENELSAHYHPQDRSYFYQHLHIARKK